MRCFDVSMPVSVNINNVYYESVDGLLTYSSIN